MATTGEPVLLAPSVHPSLSGTPNKIVGPKPTVPPKPDVNASPNLAKSPLPTLQSSANAVRPMEYISNGGTGRPISLSTMPGTPSSIAGKVTDGSIPPPVQARRLSSTSTTILMSTTPQTNPPAGGNDSNFISPPLAFANPPVSVRRASGTFPLPSKLVAAPVPEFEPPGTEVKALEKEKPEERASEVICQQRQSQSQPSQSITPPPSAPLVSTNSGTVRNPPTPKSASRKPQAPPLPASPPPVNARKSVSAVLEPTRRESVESVEVVVTSPTKKEEIATLPVPEPSEKVCKPKEVLDVKRLSISEKDSVSKTLQVLPVLRPQVVAQRPKEMDDIRTISSITLLTPNRALQSPQDLAVVVRTRNDADSDDDDDDEEEGSLKDSRCGKYKVHWDRFSEVMFRIATCCVKCLGPV